MLRCTDTVAEHIMIMLLPYSPLRTDCRCLHRQLRLGETAPGRPFMLLAGLPPERDHSAAARYDTGAPGAVPRRGWVRHRTLPIDQDVNEDELEDEGCVEPPRTVRFCGVFVSLLLLCPLWCVARLPGAYHAVLPNPQIGQSIVASVRFDAALSGTSCGLPPCLNTSLARAKRKPSNVLASLYRDPSFIMARCGTQTQSPSPNREPSRKTKGAKALRLPVTVATHHPVSIRIPRRIQRSDSFAYQHPSCCIGSTP